MTFTVGQEVTWKSQAQGCTKEKVGVVVQVVPAEKWLKEVIRPLDARQQYSLRTDFAGFPRKHESYLVAVPGKTERAKKQLYWPRVSALSLVESKSEA